MAMKKMGIVTVAGAGTGMFANLVEGVFANVPEVVGSNVEPNIEPNVVIENKAGSSLEHQELFRGPRVGFKPSVTENTGVKVEAEHITLKPKMGHIPKPVVETQTPENPNVSEPEPLEVPTKPTQTETSNTAESIVSEKQEFVEPKLPQEDHPFVGPIEPKESDFVGPMLPKEEGFVGPKLPQEEIVNTATVEKIFENPENLKHIKIEGKTNSFWNVVQKGLEENEQFRGFTEAQKNNAISYFTNKGIGREIGDPEKYGLTSDPDFGVKVETGKEIDLSKLLGDAEEVKKVLDGAAKKTLEEQQNILHKDAQIATYLQENPNVKLTNDKVAEILATKPKVEAINEIPEPSESEAPVEPSPILKTPTEVEPIKSNIPETLENPVIVEPIKSGISDNLETNSDSDSELGPMAEPLPPPELEGSKHLVNDVRSMASDVNNILSGSKLEAQVEEAVFNGIDDVYGKDGFLGLGKVAGVNTPEWGKMAKFPANNVVEYYTGDSNRAELPEEIINELSQSKKHSILMKQVIGLMEQTNNTVKPYNNENVEKFLRRLVKYSLEHPQNQLSKVA